MNLTDEAYEDLDWDPVWSQLEVVVVYAMHTDYSKQAWTVGPTQRLFVCYHFGLML